MVIGPNNTHRYVKQKVLFRPSFHGPNITHRYVKNVI